VKKTFSVKNKDQVVNETTGSIRKLQTSAEVADLANCGLYPALVKILLKLTEFGS